MQILIEGETFSPTTPLFLTSMLYHFCRSENVDKGSFRTNLIRLVGFYKGSENFNAKELSHLFNISESTFNTKSNKQFEDYKNPKKEYSKSVSSISKSKSAEEWLSIKLYSHHHYLNVSDKSLSMMFQLYEKENQQEDNRAGYYIFSQIWEAMHVKISRHKNIDLYSCSICHGNLLKFLKEIPKKYTENFFPYHKPQLRSIYEGDYISEDNQTIVNLDIFNCFYKIFPFIWLKCTKYRLPYVIFNLISSYIVPVHLAWKILTIKIANLEMHRLRKKHQQKEFNKDIKLGRDNKNHVTIIVDFCAFKANEGGNVVELIAAVIYDNQIKYHIFVIPDGYKASKGNFVYHSLKELFELYVLKKDNTTTIFHIWSDNCSGDFINNNLFYHLSLLNSQTLKIIWNTFEQYHGHSLCDSKQGSEAKFIESMLSLITCWEKFNREFVISKIKKTKNAKLYEHKAYDDEFASTNNIMNVNGIRAHHQYIFPSKGRIIFRVISNRKGHNSEKTKLNAQKFQITNQEETEFLWHFKEKRKKKKEENDLSHKKTTKKNRRKESDDSESGDYETIKVYKKKEDSSDKNTKKKRKKKENKD